MRVDSHLHVNYKRMDADAIVSYLDRNRLDKCWLLTWEEASPPNPGYMSLPVEEVYKAYDRYKDRIVPMYAPTRGGRMQ